jgi:hypothetical protein
MSLKRFIAAAALSCALMASAQTKTPLVQPHWNFFDQSGSACAGCSLYSYLAGTTTPTPTYTDATGATQNTNPIVLGTDGGAFVWVGTPTIKLILKDASGTLIWTADNIPAGGGGGATVCGPASSIQFANSTVTGLDCDGLITINKIAHTINVGGPLPALNFTLTNLSPVTASWVFDVSSPITAALSLGGGTAGSGKYIDGGTGIWTALPSPGLGTVTNIAVTVPTQMSIGGSPITSSGTFAIGLNTTGSAVDVVTASAAGTSGNCGQWSSGNLGDAGQPCGIKPVLATGTNGYYTATAVTLSGSPITLYDEDVSTGALNNNTPTTVTLPHSISTQILSCVCSDNGGRVQTGNNQPIGCNAGTSPSYPLAAVQVNALATTMTAYCRVRGY